MHFCFVVKSLALPGGGAERVLVEIANQLARRAYKITVLTFDEPGAPTFYRLHDKVILVQLNCGPIDTPTRFKDLPRRAWALRKATQGCDAVIGFMHSAFVPARLGLLGTGRRLIGSEHIVYQHYSSSRLQRALMLFWPRSLTAVSEQMRGTFPAFLRKRMVVIPNPVVEATGRADPRGGATKTILSVGRLEAQKWHEGLIAAFASLASEFPNWRLRIVGEGCLRRRLERRVRDLQIEDRVALPGAIADIGREYTSAQIFAMPSQYESFGLATAEAMAHGLPTVGLKSCPGTNLLVRNGDTGVLTDDLAEGLRTLMESAELRISMGKNAAIGRTSNLLVCEAWEDLLRS